MPSNFSRSVSFIDAEPIMNDPVVVTSALTTTFALKFVTSLTSIALESIPFISDTNNPPTTSRPSFTRTFEESVDSIELTSKVAVVIVPVAVMFLNKIFFSAFLFHIQHMLFTSYCVGISSSRIGLTYHLHQFFFSKCCGCDSVMSL